MQRSRIFASLYILFVPAGLSLAQSPTSSAAPAYVTIAFNTAVLKTEEAQHLFTDLQSKFAPRQTHLQQLNAQIETLKKQINDPAGALSETDKAAKLRTLDTTERQLQRDADDFKNDTDNASQQAFQSVALKVYAFLQDFAKRHAYTLVIDRGSEAAPVVWYAAGNADITAELIKAYDLKAAAKPDVQRNTEPPLPLAPKPHQD